MMRRLLLTTMLTFGVTPALADDAALLLGIERYERLDRLLQGTAPAQSGSALEQAGFKVFAGVNTDKNAMRLLAEGFQAEVSDADRLIASLSGRFANDGMRSWFLASNAAEPQLFGVMDRAIAVETVLQLLAEAPGQAILMIGEDSSDDQVYDGPLRAGLAPLDIPQGVTVIRGRPGAIADLLDDAVADPDENVLRQARRTRGIQIEGYQPEELVMTKSDAGPVVQSAEPSNLGASGNGQDQTAWDEALAQDSAQGYLAYMARFPRGQYLDEARTRLAAIRAEPNRAERLAEEALSLSREARRAVQRDLNVLDYDTRGIDGIFGPGTRRAVTNWQQQNGLSQTGYLNANQIVRLDAQASRRSAELEAAAERQRVEEERRDRAYWEETGSRGDEAGYRAYIARYPDGLFAKAATERLDQIEEGKRQRAQAEERAAWDRARSRNTVSAYRTYMDQYPRGSFVDAAQSRISALEQSDQNAGSRQQALVGEEQLGLDPITLRLIEAKLQQLGLEPGAVDGQIDGETRRAIRRYQRDRDLERTGFLNQATVSRLLRDAFR